MDIDTTTRLKDMIDRAQKAAPGVMDEAIASGDYSEVDRANDVIARLRKLSDHHAEMISQAQQEDQAKGIGMPQTAGPSAPGSNLPALDPQDAQLPNRAVASLTPTYMKLSPGNYPTALPNFNQANAMPGTQTQAPPAPPPSALPQEAPQSALPAPPQDAELPDHHYLPIDPEQQRRDALGAEFERNMRGNADTPATASEALDILLRMGDSDKASAALDSAINGGSALPQQQSAQASITPGDVSGIQSEYGSDPVRLASDVANSPDMSKYAREYAFRVQTELGQRPEHATLAKVLMALAQGLGSALGLWVSKKNYEGEAFTDLTKDERDYDARRAQIGREVYGAQSRENVAQAKGDQGMAKVQAQETGKNDRQNVAIAAKKDALATTEEGKNTRQAKALDSRQLLESIKAKTKNIAPQMSIADKAEINRLHLAYSGLDRTLMTVDPKVRAQGDDILRQISDIIKKYQ